MKSTLRIAIAYLAVTMALSCVSLTYEWLEAVDGPEGTFDWYGEVGLRNGFFVWGGHSPPGPAGLAELHAPAFMPLPVGAAVGPEGGGIYMAVWFPPLLAATVHFLWRTYRKKRAAYGRSMLTSRE